jgi:hypothetical protein
MLQRLLIVFICYKIDISYNIQISIKFKKIVLKFFVLFVALKPSDCICTCSLFIYNLPGQIKTGNHNIINNTSLRVVFAKWPKYRRHKSINRPFARFRLDSKIIRFWRVVKYFRCNILWRVYNNDLTITKIDIS